MTRVIDDDAEAEAMIRANVERSKELQDRLPPDPAKEPIMTLWNAMEQRRRIKVLLARMQSRHYAQGPRGE